MASGGSGLSGGTTVGSFSGVVTSVAWPRSGSRPVGRRKTAAISAAKIAPVRKYGQMLENLVLASVKAVDE